MPKALGICISITGTRTGKLRARLKIDNRATAVDAERFYREHGSHFEVTIGGEKWDYLPTEWKQMIIIRARKYADKLLLQTFVKKPSCITGACWSDNCHGCTGLHGKCTCPCHDTARDDYIATREVYDHEFESQRVEDNLPTQLSVLCRDCGGSRLSSFHPDELPFG